MRRQMPTGTIRRKWNPINVCSYHLRGGATRSRRSRTHRDRDRRLDAVRDSGKIHLSDAIVGQISFFVNAGVRFIEEIAKMRTFTRCGRNLSNPLRRRGRHLRLFATACRSTPSASPNKAENNVQRIVLEMLGVTLSADARDARCNCGVEQASVSAPPTSSEPADAAVSLRE